MASSSFFHLRRHAIKHTASAAAAAASAAAAAAAAAALLMGHTTLHKETEAQSQSQYPAAGDYSGLNKWSHVGLPGGDTTYIFKDNFVICYDSRTRNPKWVMERATRATCTGDADRRVLEFYEESTILDPRFRSKNSDYLMSGYDRGHQAPAANNRSSSVAMEQTFSLANISPQVGPGFNRDMWARVEKFIRDLTKRCETVYIVTGPLFLPVRKQERSHNGQVWNIGGGGGSGGDDVDNNNNPASKAKYVMNHELIGDPPGLVAVPTHFFKVVLAEMEGGQRRLLAAFVLPNAPIPATVPLRRFLVPIDSLERVAGFRFFAQYLDEERKEMVDARVPMLRGDVGGGRGSERDGDLAAPLLLTDGSLSPSSSSSRSNNSSALVVRRGDRGANGGGGLKLNLDGPEHLCDVLVCQLPPEKFWEIPKHRGGGSKAGKKNGGRGQGQAQDKHPEEMERPSFLQALWPAGSGGEGEVRKGGSSP